MKQKHPLTTPEKGYMSPRIQPGFPGDPIYNEGCQAWAMGRGDCPYVEDLSKLAAGWDYWETPAGMRMRWLAGFNATSTRAQKTGTPEMVRRILGDRECAI